MSKEGDNKTVGVDGPMLGAGAPPPPGFRIASDANGVAFDPFTPAERKAFADAKEAARKAELETEDGKGAEIFFKDPPRQRDALDDVVDALLLGDPRHVVGETADAKKRRERAALDAGRQAAIKRTSEAVEDGFKVRPAARAYMREMMKPDETEEEKENAYYDHQERELEKELENVWGSE